MERRERANLGLNTLLLLPTAPPPQNSSVRGSWGLGAGRSAAVAASVAITLLLLTPAPGKQAGLRHVHTRCAAHRGAAGTNCLVAIEPKADPATFSAEELHELQNRFGVHGPQPRLAQLFTEGLDDLAPLRAHTLGRLADLRPKVLEESQRRGVNPMLMAAILFDEMQHAKPGKDVPLAAHSGLFRDHGPAQLSVDELVHQGLLRPEASPGEVDAAVARLLDPEQNVAILAGQLARLQGLLGVPKGHRLQVSTNPHDAKIAATLAYLHNGKLDYPQRILRYMQDPELHALIYTVQERPVSPLI